MNSNTTFVRTSKGEDEMRNKSAYLVGDIKRALLMVDGIATFGEISKRAAPSLRSVLNEMFGELERGGFIQDKLAQKKAPVGGAPRMAEPFKMAVPRKRPANEGAELDFTSMFRAPSAEMLAEEAKKADTAKLKMAVEAKARAQDEAKAKQEAEAARIRAEGEAKARKEIEAAKLKAQREAEEARLRAEREAAKAREEAEFAKQKVLAEARAREEAERRAKDEAEAARVRAELEAAKAKAAAEAKARAEAEAKARKEIEAAKLKAQQEAEAKARQEIEAAKLKAQQEAEQARLKAERETAKAREEAERWAREEAEAVLRAKAEQEAARAELEAVKAKAEAEAKAREEAERRSREEAEATKLKAQQEAEVERLKAEQKAARAREEAELARRQTEEAKAREEAEQRARQEVARARAETEAKAREEAERRSREEADKAKLRTQQEAEEARLEAARETARAREEAESRAGQDSETAARLKAQREAEAHKSRTGTYQAARSTSATVLFFDVVGYTKQPFNKQIEIKKQFNQLVSDSLSALDEGDRIILDTGDGAAIGFLQHPEDALEVAMQFRDTLMANRHLDYPGLNVRIGIHLGPINVVKDMNGQSNMLGDGINDAQRVMSFADIDQIYISRSYYDFISRLNDEYAGMFQYRGLQKDKHGREHAVYELKDAAAPAAATAPPQASEPDMAITLEPFKFTIPEAVISPEPSVVNEKPQPRDDVILLGGMGQFDIHEEAVENPVEAAEPARQELPPVEPETPAPTKAADKATAEARMPSTEDVAKLAEAQAKVWAEAERRRAETAAASSERAAQPREAQQPAKEKPVARTRGKPVPWGKIGAGLFVALLAAPFAIPPLMPTQGYATGIEQMLAAKLKQPVHVGQLAGRLLPTPRLELTNISIGEMKPIQAQRAQIDFALSALFSSDKPIAGIELEGVRVNGAALTQVAAWLQQISADARYPVARIGLSQGKLEADGVQLSGIGGEINFNQAGKFTQAKLYSEGSKLVLDLNAAPDNKMQVSITARGSALPLLPNWVFDDLSAKGELGGDGLVITGLDGRIKGGILLGDARIDWRSGWRAEGNLTAKLITLQNLSKALSGDMDGTARFKMQSASLDKLTETATLEGAFSIKKGVLNSVDIVETARLRSAESLAGGRTHFDELSGDLFYANGDYHFRQVKMSTGVLNATATLDIARQQVSGRVVADLTMRAGMGPIALQVGGTTDNPSLRAVRQSRETESSP